MVDSISGGSSAFQANYGSEPVDAIDLEEEHKNQMAHFQPEAQRDIMGATSSDSGSSESSSPIGDALGAFGSMMLRANSDGSPLDPRGITGEETFGNVIGDTPVQIQEDGARQNQRMGFTPNEITPNFENIIGDTPIQIPEEGVHQDDRIGFIPNEFIPNDSVKAHMLDNGV